MKRGPPEKMATRPPSLKPQNWGMQLLGRERTAFGGEETGSEALSSEVGCRGQSRAHEAPRPGCPQTPSGRLRSRPAVPTSPPPPPPAAEALRLSQSELRQQNTKTTEDSLLLHLQAFSQQLKRMSNYSAHSPRCQHGNTGARGALGGGLVCGAPLPSKDGRPRGGLPGPEGEEG